MPLLRQRSVEFLIGSAPPVSLEVLALAALASLAIVIAAWRFGALTVSGSIAAFFVGAACLGCGGFVVAAPLFVFFVSGTLLARVRPADRAGYDDVQHKRGARDAAQVLANGGAAAACAVAAGASALTAPGLAHAWQAASIGALAVAAADTWATELGARSPVLPRSIATGRVVKPGVSGGVTALGFVSSVAGGLAIGAAASVFAPAMRTIGWIAAYGVIGFVGAAFDSLLGATLQGAWRCDRCGAPCEASVHRCGAAAHIVTGASWLDNDGVNALATAAGAALGFAAAAFAM